MAEHYLAPTPATPWQTVGPYFHRALLQWGQLGDLAFGDDLETLQLRGQVLDGAGNPVDNAMVEAWTPTVAGRSAYDGRRPPLLRSSTEGGGYSLRIPAGWAHGSTRGYVNLAVYAPGLVRRLLTRAHFEADAIDELLADRLGPGRVDTLLACPEGGVGSYRFDITLQGHAETAFLTY